MVRIGQVVWVIDLCDDVGVFWLIALRGLVTINHGLASGNVLIRISIPGSNPVFFESSFSRPRNAWASAAVGRCILSGRFGVSRSGGVSLLESYRSSRRQVGR